MKSVRRWITALAAMLVLANLPSAGFAQSFPAKPLRIVLGGAPGTVIDVAARQIADKLAPLLGRAAIVDNRPSAGGIVALEAVKNSPPDGYTLGLVHMAQMSVAPSLFEHLPYDTVDDFAHVGILWRGPQVLVVNAGVAASSLAELTTMALARPGQLRYGSTGNGTPTHIIMEQFKLAAGVDIQHIPYKGPAAHLAILRGEVDVLLEGLAPLLAHIRAGKLKALAVSGTQRLAALPEVPTFEERGIAGIGTVWVGVIAPRDTPPPVVAQLNRALRQIVESPDIRALFEGAGRNVTPGTPDEMKATIRDEIPRWRDVVRRAQIKPG